MAFLDEKSSIWEHKMQQKALLTQSQQSENVCHGSHNKIIDHLNQLIKKIILFSVVIRYI